MPALPGYHAAPAAAADLCRRAGRGAEAAAHYKAALALARQEPERLFLRRRLAEVEA
jgi:RNA polymerase sigma-70 factor (ECF subfamily)